MVSSKLRVRENTYSRRDPFHYHLVASQCQASLEHRRDGWTAESRWLHSLHRNLADDEVRGQALQQAARDANSARERTDSCRQEYSNLVLSGGRSEARQTSVWRKMTGARTRGYHVVDDEDWRSALALSQNRPQNLISVSSMSRGRCGPNSMHECCHLPAVVIGQSTLDNAEHHMAWLFRTNQSCSGLGSCMWPLAISGSHSCQRIPKPIETTRHRLHGENRWNALSWDHFASLLETHKAAVACRTQLMGCRWIWTWDLTDWASRVDLRAQLSNFSQLQIVQVSSWPYSVFGPLPLQHQPVRGQCREKRLACEQRMNFEQPGCRDDCESCPGLAHNPQPMNLEMKLCAGKGVQCEARVIADQLNVHRLHQSRWPNANVKDTSVLRKASISCGISGSRRVGLAWNNMRFPGARRRRSEWRRRCDYISFARGKQSDVTPRILYFTVLTIEDGSHLVGLSNRVVEGGGCKNSADDTWNSIPSEKIHGQRQEREDPPGHIALITSRHTNSRKTHANATIRYCCFHSSIPVADWHSTDMRLRSPSSSGSRPVLFLPKPPNASQNAIPYA
ncbi:uncharacterized protein MYCFIDRAFT_208096 [Pseudocercospora fijiensis CIRAD86]|uniref:Uncharacterized protein n=1 Tax=Pseudocercospora fijiensis (strain CIRAD86) TaxID=383855 RepID=M3AYT9_PSEFD|nr:uncharacterized protein MYCFIDRAFT_208096 [Pseudocercospora fijiensis CIRAD86]EME82362.1 hypothetical protein MYCFIDRAFT_208096 [Pseudocercospora fijiensis CIRAD86]